MRLSLRARWIGTTVALLCALVAVLTGLFVHNLLGLARTQAASQRERAETEAARSSRMLARRIAVVSRQALLSQSFTLVQELLASVARDDAEVRTAFVTSADGVAVAHTQAGRTGQRAELPALARRLDGSEEVIELDAAAEVLRYAQRFDAAGVRVGAVWIEYSLQRYAREAQASQAALRAQAQHAVVLALGAGAAIVLVGILLVVLQTYRITRPLAALAEATRRIADGDFGHRVGIAGQDEVSLLGQRFDQMAAQLQDLLAQATERAASERELDLARDIQRTLLPPETPRAVGVLDLAGCVVSASACGGDLWLSRAIDGDRTLVLVGDVSGHGMPAAMVMATAVGSFRSFLSSEAHLANPDALLAAINASIVGFGERDLGMTCFASVVDRRAGRVRYASAGHLPAFLCRASEGDRAVTLFARGPCLGDTEHPTFTVHEERVAPGDLLIWYTDGVTERRSAGGEAFGSRRMLGAITSHAAEPPASLRQRVLTALDAFAGGAPGDDDITLVVGRVLARPDPG